MTSCAGEAKPNRSNAFRTRETIAKQQGEREGLIWQSRSQQIVTFLPLWLIILFLGAQLLAEPINTFYGTIEVKEPVLIELIHSPAMQRLKSIHQYGISYYTTHREEYNRFDHSLGVFAILRLKGASLEEQIAGLLHDVSHTTFSHLGDWIFGKEYQENDYQTTIHRLHLAVSGVEKILNKYGLSVEHILPKLPSFTMLEQPLPNLSADRIDYNIQGAYFQHFLSKEEAQELFQDLSFENGKWVTTKKHLAAKLMRFSLFMTENCWGSAINYVTSRWLSDAILQGIKIGLISWHEFHFGIDQNIWDKLRNSKDPLIQKRMEMITHPDPFYQFVAPSQANTLVKFKCRGVDPWIKKEGTIARLTSIDPELFDALLKIKEKAIAGWPLEIRSAADPLRKSVDLL